MPPRIVERFFGEDASLRTEDGKHFRMSDGSFMAVSYGMPVHYQDENGAWQEIDNRITISASQDAYTAQNGETVTYTYDSQGQLLKAAGDTTYTYTYDTAGNILTASDGTASHTYTYGDSTWRDLLTAFDGEAITYDTIGNPTSYYNGTRWTFGWENGRQLISASGNGKTISYTYTADGQRVTKTVDGVKHTYYYAGSLLMREVYGSNVLDFSYTPDGKPYSLTYNGTTYYYILNLQGDVARVVTADGTMVAGYFYDAYGKLTEANGDFAATNPLRYRGYYYDSETGLYYVSSRYYDPEIGRWICSDVLASTGQGILGTNMFAYCGNNPVSRVDIGGYFWDTVFDVASLVLSVVEVVNNPDDVGAWVGLVCDVVDVAIPFVGGLGETARAVNAVMEVADTVDDIHDAGKATQRSLEAIETASKTLNSGCNTVYVSYVGDTIEYVGITNDFRRRKQEWEGIRDIVEYIPGLDRKGARYVEQAVIDTFGMAKNGGILSNKINSIGVRNPLYKDYLQFFNQIVK